MYDASGTISKKESTEAVETATDFVQEISRMLDVSP